MDAKAHLIRQGWLGPGHALDSRISTPTATPPPSATSTHAVHEATRQKLLDYNHKGHRGLAYDPSSTANPASASGAAQTITQGNGLVRPLLISQRRKNFGIGKKAHEPASGNEWWLKGFAAALGNVGKSESERSSGTSTPTGTAAGNIDGLFNGNGRLAGKYGGLYGFFVRGETVGGTLKEERGRKRKSDVLEEKEEGDFEKSVEYLTRRDRERKKGHKSVKSTGVEQFEVVGAFLGAVDADVRRKKRKSDRLRDDEQGESSATGSEETKEQRKARRRDKTKPEEKRDRTLAQMVEEELAKLAAEDSAAQKARRKEERKRKKGLESGSSSRSVGVAV